MWRHYLLGRIFFLIIDHYGIKYLFNRSILNVRQAKRMEFISKFDFEIKHIMGKENRLANILRKNVQTVHLETTSVGEFDIKKRIKPLF
jgi:hypothetical protein